MLTIGQHIDAIRARCSELGFAVQIDIRAHNLPGHDAAEAAAIQMANELQGIMSGARHPDERQYPGSPTRWYEVTRRDVCGTVMFAAFWLEKENTAREQAVV